MMPCSDHGRNIQSKIFYTMPLISCIAINSLAIVLPTPYNGKKLPSGLKQLNWCCMHQSSFLIYSYSHYFTLYFVSHLY